MATSALPSLRQLRYLVELSERLNFRQAAEASFVTQSTLSRRRRAAATASASRAETRASADVVTISRCNVSSASRVTRPLTR